VSRQAGHRGNCDWIQPPVDSPLRRAVVPISSADRGDIGIVRRYRLTVSLAAELSRRSDQVRAAGSHGFPHLAFVNLLLFPFDLTGIERYLANRARGRPNQEEGAAIIRIPKPN
jgi:hypothetical protein